MVMTKLSFMRKIFLCLLLSMPLLVFAEGEITISNPLTATSVEAIVNNVMDFVLKVGVALAPVMAVLAGFFYITAQGDPNKIKKANAIIFWTIVGLGIILLSKGIVVVVRQLLGVKG